MKRKLKKDRAARAFEYDICLSFAGEDRSYVRQVAQGLRRTGVRVFFDEYAQADMWGKDLYTHLDDIYQNAARFCLLFASRYYAKRVWTNHERESAQARAIREHGEYILPARFDSTKIPGLKPTVGYIDLRRTTRAQLVKLLVQKLGTRQKEKYFPPIPDRLFVSTNARSVKARQRVEGRARDFFNALTRMTADEHEVIITIFRNGCPSELPDNIHINLDLLRRLTGFTPSKILRLIGGVRSLGFYVDLRDDDEDDHLPGKSKIVVLEWHDMTTDDEVGGNATGEANDMIHVGGEGYCEEHSIECLRHLNFSQLASATRSSDRRG